MPTLTLRPISVHEHREFLATRPEATFLQQPEWAEVKAGWSAESLGWTLDGTLVGAALVLYRTAPVVKKSLAYIPMGPVIDWEAYPVTAILSPLRDYLARKGAFAVRVGPPVDVTQWDAAAVRKALGTEGHSTLEDLEPATRHALGQTVMDGLHASGFRALSAGLDFHAGQPEYVARIPLVDEDGGQLTVDQVLKSFSSTTRRQTRNAMKGDLQIVEGGLQDVSRFYELYRLTADRQEFTGRALSYFENLYTQLNEASPGACRVYIAEHAGQDLAAVIYVRYGTYSMYMYGASSEEHRELQAPKALQLKMIEESVAAGCTTLDQGGVTATLQMDGDHAGGLTKFKTSIGADIVQTVGEWELALNRPLAWAFSRYMAWRAR